MINEIVYTNKEKDFFGFLFDKFKTSYNSIDGIGVSGLLFKAGLDKVFTINI